MKQLLNFVTSPAGTSLLAIIASVLGLIVRRWTPPGRDRGEPGRSQANTAHIRGDGNITLQTIHHEEHTYTNVSGGRASNNGGSDEVLLALFALLLATAVALIGFAYANRFTPVIVGALALFVTFASRSRLISLMNALLAAVSFAGYLYWTHIKFGDASLEGVKGLKYSGVGVLLDWSDLTSDQRFLYGTSLFVLLVAIVLTSATAVMLVKERASGLDTRPANDLPLAAVTGIVAAAIVLTWVGVLPRLVQRL